MDLAGCPIGASETNNCGLGQRELQTMDTLMGSYDLMIIDRAFRSLRGKLNLLCGWTKKKNKQLKAWQQQENNEIFLERS